MFFKVLLAAFLLAVLASEKRLIRTSDTESAWMTEDEILALIQKKIGFMDVTDFDVTAFKPPSPGNIKYLKIKESSQKN